MNQDPLYRIIARACHPLLLARRSPDIFDLLIATRNAIENNPLRADKVQTEIITDYFIQPR